MRERVKPVQWRSIKRSKGVTMIHSMYCASPKLHHQRLFSCLLGDRWFADKSGTDRTHPAIEDGASRRERRSSRKLVRSATSRPEKLDRHRRIRQIRRQSRVRDRGRDQDGKGEVVERATTFRTRVGDKGGEEGGEGEDAEEGPGVVAAVRGQTNVGVDL